MINKGTHSFRKKWGQNFLIDSNIVKKIYRTIEPIDSDNILEIGPGEGVLTKIILPEVNKMVSIEIDPVLVNKLNNSNQLKKLKVVKKIGILRGVATDLKFCKKVINSKINEIYYLAGDSSVIKSFETPDISLKSNTEGILNILQYNRFKAHFLKLGSHRDINPYIIKSMFEYIRSENPTNLLFVHNRVPHLCHKCGDGLAGMAEKYFDFKYRKKDNYLNLLSDRKEAYFINLKFIDSLVGEIFDEIDKNRSYKKNKTLVILSSDHWAKDYYGDFITRPNNDNSTPYPTLFVAKIIGDDEKFDIYSADSGIHVQELIHNFLNKKISSHSDINEFFSKKNGYSVLMDVEMKFSVEKDF